MTINKKHVVFLTVDEMLSLQQLADMFIAEDGVPHLLTKVPLSQQFLSDLKKAAEKLNQKIDEVSDGP